MSGNGNDGDVSSISYITVPGGSLRAAVMFAGSTNSFVHVAHGGSLDALYSLSVFMYIYVEHDGFIFNYGQGESGVGFYYEGTQLSFRFREKDQGLQFPETVVSTVDKNQWYHAGVTYDYVTGVANLYIDGEMTNSRTFTNQRKLATSADLYLGAIDNQNLPDFQGAISCLYIYDRAINEQEITDTMTCPDRKYWSNVQLK